MWLEETMQSVEKVEAHDNDVVTKGDSHPVKEVDSVKESLWAAHALLPGVV